MNHASVSLLFLLFLAKSPALLGQNADPDAAIFSEKIRIAQSKTSLPERLVAVANSFVGAPYVSGTLDQNADENLVVNLRQFDCWTFVESCLALAQTAQAGRSDFDFFRENLRQLRYWGGTVSGYGSRIHYFTGWALQAEKRGILVDLTQNLGGQRLAKQFNFISDHPKFYPKLSDDATRSAIERAEARINAHHWFFIPKSKVAQAQRQIQTGDIIAETSSKSGLDIAHQGIAVRRGAEVFVLHASSEFGRVMLTKWPLPRYLARNKGQSGIMVFRLNG